MRKLPRHRLSTRQPSVLASTKQRDLVLRVGINEAKEPGRLKTSVDPPLRLFGTLFNEDFSQQGP